MKWVAPLLIATALAGCGGTTPDPGPGGPRGVAERFMHALGRGDERQACALMTPRLRRTFLAQSKASACPAAWAEALAETSEGQRRRYATAVVARVFQRGDT